MPYTWSVLSSDEYAAWDAAVALRSVPLGFCQTTAWPGEFFICGARNESGALVAGVRIEIRGLWLGKKMGWIRGVGSDEPCVVTDDSVRDKSELLGDFFTFIRKIAPLHQIIFYRMYGTENIPGAREPEFLHHIADPETVLCVDLRNSSEELLAQMHQKTRYNIRYAEQKGVEMREENSAEHFYPLYQETNHRKGIQGYRREYVDTLLKVSSPLRTIVLTAYQGATPIASNVLLGCGPVCTYLFGGTSDANRAVMAPHLLQWQGIEWARKQGYIWYDLGGISDTRNEWEGITRFKRGFVSDKTGKEISIGAARDFVTDPLWYAVFSFGKKIIR